MPHGLIPKYCNKLIRAEIIDATVAMISKVSSLLFLFFMFPSFQLLYYNDTVIKSMKFDKKFKKIMYKNAAVTGFIAKTVKQVSRPFLKYFSNPQSNISNADLYQRAIERDQKKIADDFNRIGKDMYVVLGTYKSKNDNG